MKHTITSQQVLDRLKKSTNINNTNNTNNTNDTNNLITSIIVEDHNQEVVNASGVSSGLASLPARPLALPKEIHFKSGSELPPAWMNFKWDLFKNPSGLKLVCNIIKLDSTKQSLSASLNSPHDRVWLKVEDRSSDHWQLVQTQYKLWRTQLGKELTDCRISKMVLPGKKGSVEVCVFFTDTEMDYCIRMIYRGKIYDYAIPKSSMELLTIKQLSKNQIATLYVGAKKNNFVNLDDLGI